MRHRLTSLITIQSSWGRWGSTWCNRWPRNVRGQSTPEAGGAQTAARLRLDLWDQLAQAPVPTGAVRPVACSRSWRTTLSGTAKPPGCAVPVSAANTVATTAP
jgi:hypothetical protein